MLGRQARLTCDCQLVDNLWTWQWICWIPLFLQPFTSTRTLGSEPPSTSQLPTTTALPTPTEEDSPLFGPIILILAMAGLLTALLVLVICGILWYVVCTHQLWHHDKCSPPFSVHSFIPWHQPHSQSVSLILSPPKLSHYNYSLIPVWSLSV